MRRILRDRSNSSAAMCVVRVCVCVCVWSRWCLSTTRQVSTSITRYSSEQCVLASWQPLNCRRPRDNANNIHWCWKTRWRPLSHSTPRATLPTYKYHHRPPYLHSPRYNAICFSFGFLHRAVLVLHKKYTSKWICAAEKTHICAVKMCAKTRLRPGLWRNLQCPKPPRLDLEGVSRIRDRAKDGDGKGKEEVCEGHRRWWRTGCEGLGCVVLKNPFILILTVIMLLFYIFFYI